MKKIKCPLCQKPMDPNRSFCFRCARSYEALVRRYNDGFSIILWAAKRAWKFARKS